MNPIVIIGSGLAIAFWGGYQGSKRFPVLGTIGAVFLLIGALLLMRLDLRASTLGDGAPSSAAAFLGLMWLLEIAAVLLAGTLLWAGWRGGEHPLPKMLLIFVFVPVCVYTVFANWPAPGVHPSPAPPRTTAPQEQQQGAKKDGYIWALDSQFVSEDDCKNGAPAFLAGCREGVAANRARLDR